MATNQEARAAGQQQQQAKALWIVADALEDALDVLPTASIWRPYLVRARRALAPTCPLRRPRLIQER